MVFLLEQKILKPIFIVGVPRSGTTILYRTLCLHPDLAWFSHEDLQFWIPKEKQKDLKNHYTKMKENNEKIPKTEATLFVFGLKLNHPLPGTSKIPIEAETLWRDCFGREYITDISENKKNEVIHAIQSVLEKEKKVRFLNKSPQNSMRIFALKKIFPDAKFINIARDPRAVIASMLTRNEKEGKFDPGIPLQNKNYKKIRSLKQKFFPRVDFDVVNNYSNLYQEITENFYDFSSHFQDNFINVFYEDLLADPEKVVIKILKFCDLDKPSNLKELISRIKKTQNKWEEKLTVNDEKKIFKIVKSSIKKMRYPYKLEL